MVPPTIVQVIPHARGATAGGSGAASRAARTAVAKIGRTRRETNLNATPGRP